MSQKPGKAVSQWSTPSSRPLAARGSAENESKARTSCEPVVHSVEWATSSLGKCRNRVKSQSSPKSCVKICRLSYSLFAFGEVDQEGARIGLPSIV